MANMNEDIVDSGEEMDHVSRSNYINEKIAELKTDDSDLEKLFDLMLDMNDRLEQQEEEMRRLRNNEVVEMDRRSNSSSRCSSKPPKLHSVTRAAPIARQNMSFTNQKAKEIEKENHRLLAEIQRKKQKPKIRKPQSRKSVTTQATPPARVTASLVNRRRDAERIQFENLLLLKRLQKAKPTETIRKSTNITRSRPTTATRNTNGPKKRSNSADARSNRERANTDNTNRSSSAKNSKSNKNKNKPVWEAGW